MNALMPNTDAPAGLPQGGGPPAMAPNALMAPPQQTAAPAPMPAPSPQQIEEARKHSRAIVGGLLDLTQRPKGDLTKKDVFEAASDMLAKGAFPTQASRQQLVVELAKLPDDEPSLRKALGMFLLQTSAAQARLHELHGPGEV